MPLRRLRAGVCAVSLPPPWRWLPSLLMQTQHLYLAIKATLFTCMRTQPARLGTDDTRLRCVARFWEERRTSGSGVHTHWDRSTLILTYNVFKPLIIRFKQNSELNDAFWPLF